jgi:hypothetical protein
MRLDINLPAYVAVDSCGRSEVLGAAIGDAYVVMSTFRSVRDRVPLSVYLGKPQRLCLRHALATLGQLYTPTFCRASLSSMSSLAMVDAPTTHVPTKPGTMLGFLCHSTCIHLSVAPGQPG